MPITVAVRRHDELGSGEGLGAGQNHRRGVLAAAKCLKELDGDPVPHPGKARFHYFCFASVGRRDAGRFANREHLYDLTPALLAEYGERLERWLIEIAEDLYGRA
jgi:hypothetical protein